MKRLRNNLKIDPAPNHSDLFIISDDFAVAPQNFTSRERFLLEELRHPSSLAVIASKYNARYSPSISTHELRGFISRLDALNLLEPNEGQALPPPNPPVSPENAQQSGNQPRPPNQWTWFCPESLLDQVLPWLNFFRYLAPLLPVFFFFGVGGALFNWNELQSDLRHLSTTTNIFQNLLFSLLTTNLTTQVARGLTARYFKIPTPSFGLRLVFGVLPRFNVQVDMRAAVSRTSRLWIAAAPIVNRVFLIPAGLSLWLITRHQDSLLPSFGIALAFLATASSLFVANPLLPGPGYLWLTTYYGVENLRDRAFRSLRYVVRKPPSVVARYASEPKAILIYAILALIFTAALAIFVTLAIATWLELNYGGLGVSVTAILLLYIALNLKKTRRTDQSSNRQSQRPFLSKQNQEAALDSQIPDRWRQLLQRLFLVAKRLFFLVAVIIILFLPYRYDAGGSAVILPYLTWNIHAEHSGKVEEVFFQGGEALPAGAIIATLSNYKHIRDLEMAKAKITQLESEIRVLESTPSPEQLVVITEAINTSKLRLSYALREVDRLENMYAKSAVSLVELEASREAVDNAKQALRENEAAFNALKTQINPNQLAALRAELAGVHYDLTYYQEAFSRTMLRMPFAGTLVTMQLQNFKNSYLETGDIFAVVENHELVKVEISVPETELDIIGIGRPIKLKLNAYPNEIFHGELTEISPKATETETSQVIIVLGLFSNAERRLKPGLSGFAKIEGEQTVVIDAFSRALLRFLQVEVWSWLP